ncbi:MAG: 30S ribosomal protein S16 [Acidimicrobiia bacterium]|nr:30S ribosomal protein S16 [Acidimicrobiia bacterium]
MAVKIRLMRLGKKKQPVYRVVVSDGRKPRDSRYIEAIGRYDPRQEPSLIEIDNDKAVDWLKKGAQPTDPVRKLLEVSGAWSQYRVGRGEIHTVPAKTSSPAAPAAVVVTADDETGEDAPLEQEASDDE